MEAGPFHGDLLLLLPILRKKLKVAFVKASERKKMIALVCPSGKVTESEVANHGSHLIKRKTFTQPFSPVFVSNLVIKEMLRNTTRYQI